MSYLNKYTTEQIQEAAKVGVDKKLAELGIQGLTQNLHLLCEAMFMQGARFVLDTVTKSNDHPR